VISTPTRLSVNVLVGVPLSLDPTEVITSAALAEDVDAVVHHRPDLLPPQRFVADHKGDPGWARSAEQEREWQDLIRRSDVLLGIPGDTPQGLRDLVEAGPRVQWIQGTAAGAGEQLAGAGLAPADLERITVTTAAGVHARPLAEFALFGLLAFAKDIDVLQEAKTRQAWLPRWPMRPLSGTRLLILGLGGIGREVARLAEPFGLDVIATHRSNLGDPPPGVTALVPLSAVDDLLPTVDAVISCLPGTPETAGFLDARRIGLMAEHAVLINVGRGSVVDTPALVAALSARRLRGAVLDVFDTEPLPAESPLWAMPNLILSPHTAALAVDEDDRIVALFARNLRRFIRGRSLINVVDVARGY
jgi:glyoxylate/hydroxypyruvate reductase A